MWKYYKFGKPVLPSHPDFGRAYALYRVDGRDVERYEGNERWMVSPYRGEILLDLSGAGGNWANYTEITAEEAEQVKKRLFPEG